MTLAAFSSLFRSTHVYRRAAILGFFIAAPLLSAQRSNEDGVGEAFILQPGDQLEITFPGAPELNRNLQVRRDGVATLPIIGEVVAAGQTPRAMELELMERYEGELVTNEVVVAVLSSMFTYYLEGEVRSPGKIESFRELSALEAIIAAGGIDKTSGRLNSVVIMRRKGTTYQRFNLDLKAVLDGKDNEAFMLEPYDIVSIPQRIW